MRLGTEIKCEYCRHVSHSDAENEAHFDQMHAAKFVSDAETKATQPGRFRFENRRHFRTSAWLAQRAKRGA